MSGSSAFNSPPTTGSSGTSTSILGGGARTATGEGGADSGSKAGLAENPSEKPTGSTLGAGITQSTTAGAASFLGSSGSAKTQLGTTTGIATGATGALISSGFPVKPAATSEQSSTSSPKPPAAEDTSSAARALKRPLGNSSPTSDASQLKSKPAESSLFGTKASSSASPLAGASGATAFGAKANANPGASGNETTEPTSKTSAFGLGASTPAKTGSGSSELGNAGNTPSKTPSVFGQSTASSNISKPSSLTGATGLQLPKSATQTSIDEYLQPQKLSSLLNRWNQDLEVYVREFHRNSSEVARVDDLLIGNGYILNQIYEETEESYQIFAEVMKGMDYIEGQQDELMAKLEEFEKIFDKETKENQGEANLALADDRNTYRRLQVLNWANEANNSVNALNQSLHQAIEEAQKSQQATLAPGDDEQEHNSLEIILQILNSQLNKLRRIEASGEQLEQKLGNLSISKAQLTQDHSRVFGS